MSEILSEKELSEINIKQKYIEIIKNYGSIVSYKIKIKHKKYDYVYVDCVNKYDLKLGKYIIIYELYASKKDHIVKINKSYVLLFNNKHNLLNCVSSIV